MTSSPIARSIALHALIFLTLLARRPQVLFHGQFWAEDGSIFFADQIAFGFWHALPITYAGYLHLIPRMLAGLLSILKMVWIPTAYSISSLLIATACCGIFSWPRFRRFVSSDLLRTCAGLVAAAAIPVGGELIGSICNLQSFLAVAALALIVSGEEFSSHTATELFALFALVLIALSAPATLVFAPFLLWQLLRKRGWLQLRAAIVSAAIAVQAIKLIHTHALAGPKPSLRFNTLFIATLAGGISKCVLAPLLGSSYLSEGPAISLAAKMLAALIVCVSGFTALFIYESNRHRRIILLSALYACTASLATVMVGRGLTAAFLTFPSIPAVQGERYFFLPSCLFIFILALAADLLINATSKPGWRQLVALLFILAFTPGIVRNFKAIPMVDLSWPHYAAEIEDWQQRQRDHQPVTPLVIPINPGFTMTLQPRQ